MPAFEIRSGDIDYCDAKANLCLKITFSDGSNEFVSAFETTMSKGVLKGTLKSNGNKVVIVRADEDDSEDTVIKILLKWYLLRRFSGVRLSVLNVISYLK